VLTVGAVNLMKKKWCLSLPQIHGKMGGWISPPFFHFNKQTKWQENYDTMTKRAEW
jgi:hypothetical protein